MQQTMDRGPFLAQHRNSGTTFERYVKLGIVGIFFCSWTIQINAKISPLNLQTSVAVESEDALSDQSKYWSSNNKKVQESARRKLLEGDENAGNALRLRLFHRSALDIRNDEFLSSGEEILRIIEADKLRLRRFRESLRVVRERRMLENFVDNETTPPASSPAPSPSVLELQGRVVSGVSLPGSHGQYLTELYVGTPPKKFLFVIDTGSDLTWLPCSLCTRSCSAPPKGQALFFARKSSSFSPISCAAPLCAFLPSPIGEAVCQATFPISCAYQYIYSDQTQSTGIFVQETLSFRSRSGKRVKVPRVALGCGTNNSGPSVNTMAGLIGLGNGPISFVSQAGYIFGDKFSYCFRSFFDRGASGSLVFGDAVAETKLQDKLQMTPFVQNPLPVTFYYVAIEAVKVAGKKLAIPSSVWEIDSLGNGGTLIDSGTTLTFFPLPAYQIVVESFKSATAYPPAPSTAGLDLCFDVSGIRNPRFPSLSIIFKYGADFHPPRSNYFLSPTSNISCLAILGTSSESILGNLLQQNFFVQYDRSSNHLAFSRASCKSPR